MLVSQFQKPHFLLAYLQDYQTDPLSASPILTASVFADLMALKDITLVRYDYDERIIPEGPKIVDQLFRSYLEDFTTVDIFNNKPATFQIEDFVASRKKKWEQTEQEA